MHKRHDPVTAYADAVLSGSVPSCKWVRLACERHKRDLASGRWRWDVAEVRRRIAFFGMLRHYKGPMANKPFVLEPAQEFIVGSIYGWKRENGTRRFRYAYVEVPRKNGKTTLSGGLGIQHLLDEEGGEVYSVGTKEDQAKLSWRDGRTMVENSPELAPLITRRVKEIAYKPRESIWKPLGADSNTLDGLNPSCAIFDELHAWRDRHLWDVVNAGMGARAEPLILQITTAGSNKLGICYEHRNHICAVLEGKDGYQDDDYFGIVFTVDNEQKWDDEAEWFKANPLLGCGKELDWMRGQCQKAKQMPGNLNEFLNKQLNIWTDAAVQWMSSDAWNACAGAVDEKALEGKKCFGGLDLATNTDIAAFSLYFPDSGSLIRRYWVPRDNAREREKRDRVPYVQWIRDGFITATEGDVIDYEFIKAEVIALASRYNVIDVGIDPFAATQITQQLTDAGVNMVTFRQGFLSMSPAMKNFERLLLAKKLRHANDPVLRWMAGNVVIDTDPAGNIKPNKAKSREKIDGIVAAVMAVGRSMVDDDKTSAYVTRTKTKQESILRVL